MSFEETIEAVVRKVIREELRATGSSAVGAKALTRRQAEKAMGIGRTKLQELIATGDIKTVKNNPRLVPASEVERYCTPRRQKPRRHVRPTPRIEGDQDFDSLDADLRRRRS